MATGNRRVAYVCQSFPWVTQAFTVREIGALLEQGLDIHVMSFRRPPSEVVGQAGRELLPRSTFLPGPWSPRLVASFLRMLARHPRLLFREVVAALSARGHLYTTGSMRLRELLAVARGAWIAEQFPDAGLLHAEFADEAATAAMVAATLSGCPFSFKSHACFNPMQLDRKVRAAAFVATESAFTRREYFRELPDERVLVNHGGVIPDRAVNPSQASQELRILCVGTLQEKKGQTYLIDALRLLRDRGVPLRCLFVGSGPLQSQLAERVRGFRLEKHVEFRPYAPHEEIRELYREYNILALPAVVAGNGDRDGLPAVLIEAGNAGCVLVSTPVSGIPELIEDGYSGLLVPERDPQALADALELLAADPVRRDALAAGARAAVHDRFDLGRNVADLACRFFAILDGYPDRTVQRSHLPVGETVPSFGDGIRSDERARSSVG